MHYNKLANMRLFQNISQQSIDCINGLPITEKEFKAGELIYQFGDRIDNFLVVTKGTIKTNEYTLNGKEIVSSYYAAYEAFPFYLVFSQVKTFPYNVYCHKDTTVNLVPVEELVS